MAIGVVVRNERGENLTDFLGFVPLVGWAQRSKYPMLTHQDPYGNTILNQLQVGSLLAELNEIDAAIARLGARLALERVGSPLLSDGVLPIDEVDQVVSVYIAGLRDLGATTLAKVHRYLWFVGD